MPAFRRRTKAEKQNRARKKLIRKIKREGGLSVSSPLARRYALRIYKLIQDNTWSNSDFKQWAAILEAATRSIQQFSVNVREATENFKRTMKAYYDLRNQD